MYILTTLTGMTKTVLHLASCRLHRSIENDRVFGNYRKYTSWGLNSSICVKKQSDLVNTHAATEHNINYPQFVVGLVKIKNKHFTMKLVESLIPVKITF